MATPSKWHVILDQKPVALQEHLLEEVSKLFAQDLGRWPLEIDQAELAVAPELKEQLSADAPRPSPTLMREAFRLARWDLERDLAAFDDYMRNRRWLEHGLSPTDKGLLLFLSRFMQEQLLALGEATQGRVNRKSMLDVLDRTERRVLKGVVKA